ncbi:MAG: molybdopterin molybdotransferase MoeA [Bacteroidales bacterium]|jgi:molybdopterin molybdotransferase|nr:molybdopterin molybdotransferase MoeA [Bacteroidales bacterium]
MISFNEARSIIKNLTIETKQEEITLADACGRVLAENVVSDIDMPPYDKAAMDGYACRLSDIDKTLKVIEEIPAGYEPVKQIEQGHCSKIMTGAMVPEGADCVIMKEDIELVSDSNIKVLTYKSKSNICLKGEDVKRNDILLNRGVFIKPRHIAILASAGYSKVKVYKDPLVGVLSTGNELVEPDKKPDRSGIRNSNGWQLLAQAKEIVNDVRYFGIAKDDVNDLYSRIKLATEETDLVIISGGVSVGDYDFVPQIIEELGYDSLIKGVMVKPGKRIIVARKGDKFIVGTPGNPVSAYIQFILLIKPLIYRFLKTSDEEQIISMPVDRSFKRKGGKRTEFYPVVVTNGKVDFVDYNGSANIQAYAMANAFIEIPQGTVEINKGEKVDVRFI